jgi:osmotically-inducible protein OsmY
MKVMTRAKELIDGSGSTVKDTQKQARETLRGTQKQARETLREARKQARQTLREARKQARRQTVRARIVAERGRAQTKTKASGISSKAVGAAGAAGLAAGYFLDPEAGRRRRNVARDRALSLIRRGRKKPAANDQMLADRVKSEIFQPADAPKGSVNVNVEDGVVYLRGEVKQPDQIRKLVEEAGAVDGVRNVENLLHTP